MKKFIAVAAAGTVALCISTTAYGRMMPNMMKVQNMENKVEHKEMMLNRKITKWTNKRAIQNIERARQKLQMEKRKLMELKERLKNSSSSTSSSMNSSSSSTSSTSSSAASSAASSAQ